MTKCNLFAIANMTVEQQLLKFINDPTVKNFLTATGGQLSHVERALNDWYYQNQKQIDSTLEILAKGAQRLPYDVFTKALTDCELPLGSNEKYIICRMLDPDEKSSVIWENFVPNITVRYHRLFKAEQLGECLTDKAATESEEIKLLEDNDKWIELHLKLSTFLEITDHPSHFCDLVPLSMELSHISYRLQERLGIPSNFFIFYSPLNELMTLNVSMTTKIKTLGYTGGTFNQPTSAMLIYDYHTGLVDCPLLLYDQHIRDKARPENDLFNCNPKYLENALKVDEQEMVAFYTSSSETENE